MKNVGIIGWRGMIGSVLIQRMIEEGDFNTINSVFFTTSQQAKKAPLYSYNNYLQDAFNIEILKELDIIITCQGSYYTNIIYPKLRKSGWNGYWIDSASSLRMKNDSIIIIDPFNYESIKHGLNNGVKTFVGGNCIVSLMFMSLGGLFSKNLIEWISLSTYQAASGAGSRYLRELLLQMKYLSKNIDEELLNSTSLILDIEKKITNLIQSNIIPLNYSKVPLVCNLIPFIDNGVENGQSYEELKCQVETNKILSIEKKDMVNVNGICVRVNSLRCHSQSFMLKLKKNISLNDVENILTEHNDWIKIISNDYETTIKELTPVAVTGTLYVSIGRLRKLNIGSKYLSAFSVGDQLIWGGAEPLRRMLRFLL